VIQVNRTIASLIFNKALSDDIKDAAVQSGTILMFNQALKKVYEGITSLNEVFRVIIDHE
jgi:type II secretory ATPase GspE/PulE/Tfp pilus assembly ATPase PilB-like protein